MILENLDNLDDEVYCAISFRAGGEDSQDILTAQGIFNNMVITGGYGCYFGASGTLVGSPLVPGPGFQYDFSFDAEDSTLAANCDLSIFDTAWLEPIGAEVLIDYEGDGESVGDMVVWDNREIQTSGESGVGAGRCFYMQNQASFYCNIVFAFPQGTVLVQGFPDELIAIGASGCFQGLKATAVAGEDTTANVFTYTWTV
uniref:Uncharacterized protein n=2 Tax=Amphora coffeiformis TaxID=265554 RepID=A0A6S8ID83_9STRA